MESATATATTPAAAPARLTGFIDPHLFNLHLAAASKDETRKAIKGINFRVAGGRLHVASSNGRVLFHTEIELCDGFEAPDGFDVIVEARKVPCGARDTLCRFTIEDGRFEIATAKGAVIIPTDKDQVYPRYKKAEVDWDDAVEPEHFATFDPDYLQAVRAYVGEAAYRSSARTLPLEPEDADGTHHAKAHAPHAWRAEDGRVRRTATLMPIIA